MTGRLAGPPYPTHDATCPFQRVPLSQECECGQSEREFYKMRGNAAPPISEDMLLRAVLDMARMLGVRTAHFRPAQTQSGQWVTAIQGDGKGFPDLVLAGPGGVLYRELKSQAGRLSREQAEWMQLLGEASADFGVWRPADLRDGRIEREIRAIRTA